jgi:4,5-DOPA dioxygenase extradiol
MVQCGMAHALPTLYLSHGSPMIAIEPSPAAAFLKQLGPAIDAAFGRPRAVLIVSPHTATRVPVVLGAARHQAIHDFGGFPQALYALRYDAHGEPALAADVAARLNAAGVDTRLAEDGGMDHGIWTVLRLMWPQADVPVVPLSLVPSWSAAQQWAVGAALAPLRGDGVLIIGSGSMTHNLRRFFSGARVPAGEVAADVHAFREWVHDRAVQRDWAALRDWRVQAPHGAEQHPTHEHWLPFYIAAAAGGEAAAPQRIHASVDAGVLAMDAYAFGGQAQALAL